MQGNTVGAELCERCLVEDGGDVAIVVEGALNLVEELSGAGFDGDGAAGVALFGDYNGARGGDLRDWVPDTGP